MAKNLSTYDFFCKLTLFSQIKNGQEGRSGYCNNVSITVVNCVYVACVGEQEIFIVIFAFGFIILDRFGIYKKKYNRV